MEENTAPQPSAAPVKKISRTTRSANPPKHPKYSEMINFAVKALKMRKGSSRQAILKYVKTNYEVGTTASQHVSRNLKSMVEKKALVLASGSGASGRFRVAKPTAVPRVSAGVKKAAATKKKRARASPKKKKPAAKRSPKKKRKNAIKKRVAKKSPKKKVVRKTAKKSLKKTTIKKKGRK